MFRLASGMSQLEFAKQVGCARQYVSKIENEQATPTLSSIGRLCAALQIRPWFLMEFIDLFAGNPATLKTLEEISDENVLA